jgi:hypothetical protein
MKKLGTFFGNLVVSIVSFLVMLLLSILSFFVIVFVVSAGAGFAGLQPSGDFLVLSATLIVVAAILAGGISPIAFLTNITVQDDKNRVGN